MPHVPGEFGPSRLGLRVSHLDGITQASPLMLTLLALSCKGMFSGAENGSSLDDSRHDNLTELTQKLQESIVTDKQ